MPARGRVPSVAGMDKLEEIFRMQDGLNKRIGVNLPPPTDEEKAKAAPLALAASRTNLLLSLPMLYAMVSANLG